MLLHSLFKLYRHTPEIVHIAPDPRLLVIELHKVMLVQCERIAVRPFDSPFLSQSVQVSAFLPGGLTDGCFDLLCAKHAKAVVARSDWVFPLRGEAHAARPVQGDFDGVVNRRTSKGFWKVDEEGCGFVWDVHGVELAVVRFLGFKHAEVKSHVFDAVEVVLVGEFGQLPDTFAPVGAVVFWVDEGPGVVDGEHNAGGLTRDLFAGGCDG